MGDEARRRLVGTVRVALPPADALGLFTPLGERAWSPTWDPRFPAGDVADDAAPGTVFETVRGVEPTTWVVTAREPGRRIAYARVTPGVWAGTIDVTLEPAPDGGSVATVDYDLSALGEAGRDRLPVFEARFPGLMRDWEEAIAKAGARSREMPQAGSPRYR